MAKHNAQASSRLFLYAALVGVIAIALIVRLVYAAGNSTLDDAYITFRYVRNLTRGLGFVYNPGERVLGTTTPLFTLLLTPFAFFGADVVAVSKAINILASAENVLMVFVVARKQFGDWAALLGAMLLAISTSNVWAASTGLETEFNVLILLATMYVYISGRFNLAAILAAITAVTRPDDLILVAVMFGWHIIKTIWQKHGAQYALEPLGLFVLCLLPWALFATFYFGSPIPSSILGKAASYRVPVFDNWSMYVEQYGFALNTPRAFVSTLLFFLGVGYILRIRDDNLIFFAYFMIYSAAFILLGVRLGSGWYWQPLWPVYCIIFAAGIKYLADGVARTSASKSASPQVGVLVAIVLAVVLVFASSLKARFIDSPAPDDPVGTSLEAAGRWLNQNTESHATVGLESIGAVGWFSDRYILDEGGLVSPEVARINSRVGKPNFFTIINIFQPDYYLAWQSGESEAVTSTPQQKDWFDAHYQRVASFGTARGSLFVLFRKIAD